MNVADILSLGYLFLGWRGVEERIRKRMRFVSKRPEAGGGAG
jgi:hypothetical protein